MVMEKGLSRVKEELGDSVLFQIGISYLLLYLGIGYGAVETFIIGTTLIATNLGTTFAVIASRSKSVDLAQTRGGHSPQYNHRTLLRRTVDQAQGRCNRQRFLGSGALTQSRENAEPAKERRK